MLAAPLERADHPVSSRATGRASGQQHIHHHCQTREAKADRCPLKRGNVSLDCQPLTSRSALPHFPPHLGVLQLPSRQGTGQGRIPVSPARPRDARALATRRRLLLTLFDTVDQPAWIFCPIWRSWSCACQDIHVPRPASLSPPIHTHSRLLPCPSTPLACLLIPTPYLDPGPDLSDGAPDLGEIGRQLRPPEGALVRVVARVTPDAWPTAPAQERARYRTSAEADRYSPGGQHCTQGPPA